MAEDGYRKRRRAFRRGVIAEYYAALFLVLKGYRILQMRFRVKSGEIDIIARKRDLIVFIEVKARGDISAAIDAVSDNSRRRIQAAANQWLSRQADFAKLSWRFDIVAIRPLKLPVHLPDAF